MIVSTGIMTSTAASRGSTSMRSGGMFIVTRASTSWYTFIEASSAVMAEPTRPATRMATITGPSSRTMVRPTSVPMNCLAPKSLPCCSRSAARARCR